MFQDQYVCITRSYISKNSSLFKYQKFSDLKIKVGSYEEVTKEIKPIQPAFKTGEVIRWQVDDDWNCVALVLKVDFYLHSNKDVHEINVRNIIYDWKKEAAKNWYSNPNYSDDANLCIEPYLCFSFKIYNNDSLKYDIFCDEKIDVCDDFYINVTTDYLMEKFMSICKEVVLEDYNNEIDYCLGDSKKETEETKELVSKETVEQLFDNCYGNLVDLYIKKAIERDEKSKELYLNFVTDLFHLHNMDEDEVDLLRVKGEGYFSAKDAITIHKFLIENKVIDSETLFERFENCGILIAESLANDNYNEAIDTLTDYFGVDVIYENYSKKQLREMLKKIPLGL